MLLSPCDRDGLTLLITRANEIRLGIEGGMAVREAVYLRTAIPRPPLIPLKECLGMRPRTISSSMSMSLHGPNTGGLSGSGRVCPLGLRIGVPETTMEEARPWYPTGRWSLGEGGGADTVTLADGACSYYQFGIRAFSGPLNMVPTFVACSREE